MRRTIIAAIAIASIGLASPVDATPTFRKFSTCDELAQRWSYAIARDDASRTRYIKYQRDNYYTPTSVVVRAGVYRANTFLDADRDGVLCEEYFERIDKIGMAFRIAECVLFGGDWVDGRCVKK